MGEGTIACVDESVRTYDGATTYCLCAVVARADDVVSAENALRPLLPKGARKLHWRQMGVALQRDPLARIAGLGLGVTVVSGRPANMQRQERARRKCLELLLPLLDSAGVGGVVMESKAEPQDKRDREMAVSLIRKGRLGDVRFTQAGRGRVRDRLDRRSRQGRQGHHADAGRQHAGR